MATTAYAVRRPMERTPTQSSLASSFSITTAEATPTATASLLNKQAGSTYGMYQQCVNLRDRLERVPEFSETFLNPEVPFTPDGDATSPVHVPKDPVSQILHCLRLGSSLCFLFNALGLQRQLEVKIEDTRTSRKACKASVAHFIMACNSELPGLNADGGFLVNELFGNDTTGTAKAINCVKKLVDLLEQRGLLLEPLILSGSRKDNAPMDERAKVVRELLESERKYVQDLEVLQAYRDECAKLNAIPQDTVHKIFMNLNGLVNFQRQFLIGIEAYHDRPPQEQRFGQLFLSMEEAFNVYEPYCANFSTASDLALMETANLAKVDVLEPNHELPTFLIKPIQRICKYPLLMQQLVKTTDPTSQWYREDNEGLVCIKRVTEKVNEVKRQHENDLAVKHLEERVEDWKGHDIRMFGSLILEDTFMVLKGDTEREYHVYLFERIILCCKEVGVGGGKKGSKSNSILKRPLSKRNTKLQLKGRIFVTNVQSAAPIPPRESGPPQYVLKITWRGDLVEEHFSIKCRTSEIMQKWQASINKAVEEAMLRPRSRQAGSTTSSIRRVVTTPHSAWPATPGSEMSYTPSLFSATSEYAPSVYSQRSHANLQHATSDYLGRHYDEDSDLHDGMSNGRTTPLHRRGPGTQSLPLASRRDDGSAMRPRAQTEHMSSSSSSTNVINRWRSETPENGASMPPRSSTPSLTTSVTAKTASTEGPPSLRSSASSRGLRSKQSHEWGSAGFGRQPIAPGAYDGELSSISRNASQASLPPNQPPQAPPPLLRSRSSSSPHAYNGTAALAKSSSQQSWGDREPPVPTIPPLNIFQKQAARNGTAKRFSSSSNSTDRSSGDSSQSQGQSHTAATSPASTVPPNSARPYASQPSIPPSSGYAIKAKVNFAEDVFVIAVLSSVGYADLVEKITKKLRLCGDRSAKIDERNLRLRYVDEDGDRIKISDDDDVALAFECARATTTSGQPTLNIYAD